MPSAIEWDENKKSVNVARTNGENEVEMLPSIRCCYSSLTMQSYGLRSREWEWLRRFPFECHTIIRDVNENEKVGLMLTTGRRYSGNRTLINAFQLSNAKIEIELNTARRVHRTEWKDRRAHRSRRGRKKQKLDRNVNYREEFACAVRSE